MFNKVNNEISHYDISPFTPDNLRLVKDKKKKSFVLQLESIVSVEPYWDIKSEPDYCCVKTSDGQKIWISLSVDDLFSALNINR